MATGLGTANVTGLTWQQVDLSRKLAWIHPDPAKARRAIAVPLNDTASYLAQCKNALGAPKTAPIATLATGAPGEVSTAPMSTLPLLLIPAFLVPLFLMLHTAALMQSRRMIRGRA
jgi:hypothetical protein